MAPKQNTLVFVKMEKRGLIKEVKKPWGNEEWIVNEDYCGKFLNISRGHKTSLHYHKNKHETFYLVKGRITIDDGKSSITLTEGDVFDIVPNQPHRATAIEDSTVIEFSTHHEDEDSHRIEFGGKAE